MTNKLIATFGIDFKPISVNSMYMTRGRFRVLTTDARNFKESVLKFIETELTEEQSKILIESEALRVVITMESDNWFIKSGAVRKKDIESYSKCTNDAVFAALPIDDCKIFELCLKKKKSNRNYITYEIFEATFDEFQ